MLFKDGKIPAFTLAKALQAVFGDVDQVLLLLRRRHRKIIHVERHVDFVNGLSFSDVVPRREQRTAQIQSCTVEFEFLVHAALDVISNIR